MVAAPYADQRLARHRCRVARDVASRIAAAQHEYALAGQRRRSVVVLCVIHLAVEPSREHGLYRLPVMSNGTHHSPVAPCLTRREPDVPPGVGWRDSRHLGAVLDAPTQPRMVGERADVLEYARARGIVGVRCRHGELIERRLCARRDEVRALVHWRSRVVEIPDAAYIMMSLENIEGDVGLAKRACSGETSRSCPDDAVVVGAVERHVGRWWLVSGDQARILYPALRTVRMWSGTAGFRSSLRRNSAIWVSTVRLTTSDA